jgi:hypothetical protein
MPNMAPAVGELVAMRELLQVDPLSVHLSEVLRNRMETPAWKSAANVSTSTLCAATSRVSSAIYRANPPLIHHLLPCNHRR